MLSVGLVGLPNAGKSSLFNLITKKSVPAENFPFCTIDPSDGVIEVYDERLETLAKMSNSQKIVYSAIEFKDIAGLIKGASSGAGLGNKFLSHIREVDLILMVIRCFENQDIIHVENRVNPVEDFEILMLELTMADAESLSKIIPRLEKELLKDKFAKEKIAIAKGILEILNNSKPASDYKNPDNTDKEVEKWRKSLNLLTDKMIIKLANISLDMPNLEFDSDIKLDVATEASVIDLTPDEREELGLERVSGINNLIKTCYKALDLESYLTTGETESRSWTYLKGSTAPVCAGKIHTDFEKRFVKAEVIKFNDFVECGGRKGAIEKGKMLLAGKDYIMQDGDVVEFKIG
jgi:ribosome-binding ATPase